MDGAILPKTAPANAPPARTDPIPVRPSAPTELPAEQTVQPAAETPAVRLSTPEASPRVAEALAAVERRVSFDQNAHALVVSWVDGNKGETLRQFPTEQALRLRAYWREAARETEAPDGGAPRNILI